MIRKSFYPFTIVIWLLMSDLLSRSVGSNATFRIGLLGTAAEFPGIFGQVARVIGPHPEYLEVLQADAPKHLISATKRGARVSNTLAPCCYFPPNVITLRQMLFVVLSAGLGRVVVPRVGETALGATARSLNSSKKGWDQIDIFSCPGCLSDKRIIFLLKYLVIIVNIRPRLCHSLKKTYRNDRLAAGTDVCRTIKVGGHSLVYLSTIEFSKAYGDRPSPELSTYFGRAYEKEKRHY